MGYGFPRPIANEIDLSYYADTVMKGVSCVQGVTQKGPLSKPVLIGSAEEFERVFGGNLDSYDFPLVVKRAVSYGAALWVSRVVHRNPGDGTTAAAAASAALADRTAFPADTLKVTASSPGTWGDKLKVAVTASDIDEDTLFNLTIYKGEEVLEHLTDLSMDPVNMNYVEKIKSGSVLLADLESGAAAPDNRPLLTNGGPAALTGGNDGLGGLSDADYIGVQARRKGHRRCIRNVRAGAGVCGAGGGSLRRVEKQLRRDTGYGGGRQRWDTDSVSGWDGRHRRAGQKIGGRPQGEGAMGLRRNCGACRLQDTKVRGGVRRGMG
jgi:hypothetical protein